MLAMLQATEQYPLVELFYKGGVVMYPLLACSVISLAVIIERLIWGPSRWRVIPESLLAEISDLLRRKRFQQLEGLCQGKSTPLARLILVVLSNSDKPRQVVLDAVETSGRREAFRLQRYLGILGTIGTISPLLGLLGTVTGMITTFSVIEQRGVGYAPELAGGIAEALITTAAGLIIAIPTVIFHRYFQDRVRSLVMEMERISLSVIDALSTGEIAAQQDLAPSSETRGLS